MSRVDSQQGLMPSLLDRLIDPDSAGTAWLRGYGLAQVLDAVRRDIEDLLNTRQSQGDFPEGYAEVPRSIVAYGMPDLSTINAASAEQCSEVGRLMEALIAQFEPRLKDVRARLVGTTSDKDRRLQFHIDARLCVDPSPEVSFDTVVELTTGHAFVKPSET